MAGDGACTEYLQCTSTRRARDGVCFAANGMFVEERARGLASTTVMGRAGRLHLASGCPVPANMQRTHVTMRICGRERVHVPIP